MRRPPSGDRLTLNIAFNYAGRTELVDAFRGSPRAASRREPIDESAISGALYTAGLPDPDLVIRTGGEQRLSNFLIWQSAYAEFYSCDVLWPDFGPDAFDAALARVRPADAPLRSLSRGRRRVRQRASARSSSSRRCSSSSSWACPGSPSV